MKPLRETVFGGNIRHEFPKHLTLLTYKTHAFRFIEAYIRRYRIGAPPLVHRRFEVLFGMSLQNGIVTSPPHNSHGCVDPTMNQFRRVWEVLLPVTIVMVILLGLNFLLLRRAEKRLKAAAKNEDREVNPTRTTAFSPSYTHLDRYEPQAQNTAVTATTSACAASSAPSFISIAPRPPLYMSASDHILHAQQIALPPPCPTLPVKTIPRRFSSWEGQETRPPHY